MRRASIACFCLSAALGTTACHTKKPAPAADAGDASLKKEEAGVDGGAAAAAAIDAGSSEADGALPPAAGEELSARMRHLLEAVQQNNPDLASDALFPRNAFVSLRDTTDPQKAWDKQMAGAFRRAVDHEHRHEKGIEDAKFVSFELGHSIVQAEPKKSGLKEPLWRVRHSRLSFSVDGKTRHIDIAEMTAWRGSWYVTRLR